MTSPTQANTESTCSFRIAAFPIELRRKIKSHASARGLTMKDFVEEALARAVDQKDPPTADTAH